MKNYAVILASGTGSRFKGDKPKQFIKINNKTILEHTVCAFEKADVIDEIIVVALKGYEDYTKEILKSYKKVSKIVKGGLIRKESSSIGVFAVNDDEANILIHDCARPFISYKIIKNCLDALEKYDAVCATSPCTDTIFEIKGNKIVSIPNRRNLLRAQTPQGFKLSLIKKAHILSKNDSDFTDDCGLVLKYGLADIYAVEGDINNIKITYQNDIKLAEIIMKEKENECI